MKKILMALALFVSLSAAAQSLVLLHTNDTHSNIEPDAKGVGGILPRMAIIDSVRKAEKNVFLIDAGDMVQGTLYFNFFKGDVEYPLFNMMNYDIRILGNHEFDNGLEDLAKYWRNVKGSRLATNYDFSNTPAKGIFDPYVIKKVGKKKVGFFAINVDPTSLIVEENYAGMKFLPVIETANSTAEMLKRKGCDLVVAVTHIGYDVVNKVDDIELAKASRDIDIIIGGHSHTFVDPSTPDKTPYWIKNAAGKEVLVAQTGKYGRNVGYIKLDLDNFSNGNITYEYIPVTDRFSPDAYSKEMQEFLAPYKQKVDSVNARVVGYASQELVNGVKVGAFPNWAGDFGAAFGRQMADSLRRAGKNLPPVDFAIMNVGSIRQTWPVGDVTEGMVLATFPFANRMLLMEISGEDLVKTMKIVSPKGGESVSEDVRIVMDSTNNFQHMYVNGVEIDPNRKYVVSTIDYVAAGNDDMIPLKNHVVLWTDTQEVSARILDYVARQTAMGLPLNANPNPRFVRNVEYDIMK